MIEYSSCMNLFADGIICRVSPLFSLLICKENKVRKCNSSPYITDVCCTLSIIWSIHQFRLTGRGVRRLDFGSRCHWLNWAGLLGGEFLQADASLLEHLLHRALLLEHSLHLVLREIEHMNVRWTWTSAGNTVMVKESLSGLTLSWVVSTDSNWQQMALRSARVCSGSVSRYRSSSCRAASAPSWDWQRSTGWLASRKMPSSHHWDAWWEQWCWKWWILTLAWCWGKTPCSTALPSPMSGASPSPWAAGSSCTSGWRWSHRTPPSARCTWAWWSPRRSASSLSACHLHRPGTGRGQGRPDETHIGEMHIIENNSKHSAAVKATLPSCGAFMRWCWIQGKVGTLIMSFAIRLQGCITGESVEHVFSLPRELRH